MYLTRNNIIGFGNNIPMDTARKNLSQPYQSDADISIFLSHSHKDKELVKGIINLLSYLGKFTIYVDWQDSSMPNTTNRQTAEKIKDTIKELDTFVVLATNNAVCSRWVPWEIGIADTVKSLKSILVIPICDPGEEFKGKTQLNKLSSYQ
jgi:hypothetical protein